MRRPPRLRDESGRRRLSWCHPRFFRHFGRFRLHLWLSLWRSLHLTRRGCRCCLGPFLNIRDLFPWRGLLPLLIQLPWRCPRTTRFPAVRGLVSRCFCRRVGPDHVPQYECTPAHDQRASSHHCPKSHLHATNRCAPIGCSYTLTRHSSPSPSASRSSRPRNPARMLACMSCRCT